MARDDVTSRHSLPAGCGGLLVALAGDTLRRDTQQHAERALAQLKRRAETGTEASG